MNYEKYSLSIIIPIYNEVDNIAPLFQEIVDTCHNKFEFEAIFVDDGSNDSSREKLHALQQTNDNLTAIFHKRNFGQSAALVSGANHAKYPWIVTLDGDGQNDPADIPLLVDTLIKHQATVVLGNRKKRNDNLLRKLTSRIGNGIRQALLKDHCPDTGCSLKLFPRSLFLMIPHFNHLHRYLPALFLRAGHKLINVEVNHRPRIHGVSKYGLLNRLGVGITDLFGVMWLKNRPLNPEIDNADY